MNYEDIHAFGVHVRSMSTALGVINVTECAHLLLHIVPSDEGFWLIFKDDSGLRDRIADLMPNLKIER